MDFTKNGQRFSSLLLSNSNLVHHFYLPSLAILFHSPQPVTHCSAMKSVFKNFLHYTEEGSSLQKSHNKFQNITQD